jgi:mutual gliding-motility protein MglA
MASVNPHTRELVFKLVFYGPGLGGKTTTLQYIYAATKSEHRGKMVSLATPTDRTLYFDFLPIRVPRVRGMAVRLQLFTVPGQVYYAATRKLVLSGADAVVFVADSQAGRMETNQESLDDLHANLAEHNRRLEEVPHTFHWNKRDLSELVPIDELDRRFNQYGAPSLGTVATRGEGVFEGLERITRLVLKAYENDPKVKIEATAGTPNVSEDGVARALRQMETQGGEAPTKVSQALPDLTAVRASLSSAFETQPGVAPAPVLPSSPPPAEPMNLRGTLASEGQDNKKRAATVTGPHQKVTVPEAQPASMPETSVMPPMSGGFSLAELWPEADRERVRQAEQMIAARDAVNAILACDMLVTRIFASAASLFGTLDAPRDPAVVALMLGLDGPRYLQFRTSVRAARHREAVTMRDAVECFAFSVEARRARELLRR